MTAPRRGEQTWRCNEEVTGRGGQRLVMLDSTIIIINDIIQVEILFLLTETRQSDHRRFENRLLEEM